MLRRQRRGGGRWRNVLHSVLPPHNRLSPFPYFSRDCPSSWRRAMTGQNKKAWVTVVWACGWLYLSKRGWVEERKEEPKSSVHETKAKAGSLLPFLFFLATRQLQLRCNRYTQSWSLMLPHLLCACLPMVITMPGMNPAVQSYCVATKPSQSNPQDKEF